MPLCLTAATLAATLAIETFTLAWMHSIEKTRWEEDWRIENGVLAIAEARIRSSGAGMEPPADAVLDRGVWHYRPALPPQRFLRLTHSPYATGYELCVQGTCSPLEELLPGLGDDAVIEIRSCR